MMDSITNPYRPGAGQRPLELAGRDTIISVANTLLKRVRAGNPQRSIMLYGLRGVGKTVLLNRIEELAEVEGYITSHLEMSENDDFKRVIATHFRKILLKINRIESAKAKLKKALGVLKAFTFTIPDGPEFKFDVDAISGEADSGNFEADFVDLCVNLGHAAKEEGKAICITIDETQYIDEGSFSALIAASHRITQIELPLVFICAGLPQIAALSGDAKSYAERLFEFTKVDCLPYSETKLALISPAADLGVSFEDDAIVETFHFTKGYPYFIQELGKHTWDVAGSTTINKADVVASRSLTLQRLDESFFKVRFDRATGAEKKLMFAMADLGDGPYNMSDVAKKRGVAAKSLGPHRATLISKGFVYPPGYGQIDFSVPMFADFLRRTRNNGNNEFVGQGELGL